MAHYFYFIITWALAAGYARSQCSYPGAARISNAEYAGPDGSCGINYANYTRTETRKEIIRNEYRSRCPEVIPEGAPVYRVGGLASRGDATFYDQFRDTFESVLNEELACSEGHLFQAVALDFSEEAQQVKDGNVHFVYTNPSSFSCMMSSFGVRPIASQVVFRNVQGRTYELEYFGGAIFVRDDSNITRIEDIKKRRLRVSAVQPSGLGAMQLQWLHLQERGIHLFADAAMVVFAQTQRRVVFDVLSGRADVGFARTDQIEGMEGLLLNSGQRFSPSMVRILEPVQRHPEYTQAGEQFPFQSTTALAPEWPLGMQASTPPDVAWSVIRALAAIQKEDVAARAGRYARWRPALDYLSVVKLNVNLGIMNVTTGRCTSSADAYTPITCPPGTFKKPLRLVEHACQAAGLAAVPGGGLLNCFPPFYDEKLAATDPALALALARDAALKQGYVADDSTLMEARPYQCVCDACAPISAEPVTVRPTRLVRGRVAYEGQAVASLLGLRDDGGPCRRLDSCFSVRQGDVLTLTVLDTLGPAGREVVGLPSVRSVTWGYIGDDELEAAERNDASVATVSWTFTVRTDAVGSQLMRVVVDGTDIEASPFAFNVDSRPDEGLAGWTIAVVVIAAVVAVVLFVVMAVLLTRSQSPAFTLEEHYARIAAEMLGDIQFVKLLGSGSFGKVYHAVWQGSHVAVKVIEHVNASVIEMAEREARLSTDLAHPNIVMTLHYALRGADGTKVGAVGDGGSGATLHGASTKVGFLLRLMMGSKAHNASLHGCSMHSAYGRQSTSRVAGERVSAERSPLQWLKRGNTKSDSRSSKVASTEAPSVGNTSLLNNRQRLQALIQSVEAEQAAQPVGEATEAAGSSKALATLDILISQACDVSTPCASDSVAVSDVGAGSARVSGSARASSGARKSVRLVEEAVELCSPARRAGPASSVHCLDDDDLSMEDALDLQQGNTWGTFGFGGGDDDGQTGSRDASVAAGSAVPVQTWIIQEYCDKGSLSEMMQRRPFRDDRAAAPNMLTVLKTVLDVARGMQYLHEKGIVHSDLKTGNVLLQSVGDDSRGFRAKVADFGLSRALGDGSRTILTNTFGTVTHMPPELLQSGRLTGAADVYSFGMLMWEVYCGKHPFGNCSHAEIVTRVIVKGERPQWPPECSNLYSNIAKRCWSASEKERPTFEMLVAQLDGLQNSLA